MPLLFHHDITPIPLPPDFHQPLIEVLIGPIASGKSTIARMRAKSGAIIINDDAIVTSLHGGDYGLYDHALKPLYKAVENLLITSALLAGRSVVVDRPCHRRSTRVRYVEMARVMDLPARAVLFPDAGPAEHARRRAESDARGHTHHYWEKVAMAHDHVAEVVLRNEGFAEFCTAPDHKNVFSS